MTGAVHGGAQWQPNIRASTDYDSIVAADVNDAWYPPAPRVLEAIAGHFSISLDAIRLGAGSSDLLHHIISSCVSAGDEVMTLDPTYAEYARVAASCGATMTTRLTSSINVMVLCNPNNPTGSVMSRGDVLRMVQDAPPDCFVLIDEAYIDFAPGESLLRDAPEIENLAVVRTFSKAFAMAGLRVGYTAMSQKIRARFDQRGRPPWPVGLLGLRAADVAQIGVPILPSVTSYFLIDLEGVKTGARELLTRLAGEGIFLRDLHGFTQRDLDRFVRISTQSAAANQRIALALKQAFFES